MSALQWGSILDQHFDTASLAAARAQSAIPLRRAGRLTEMMVAGVAACLARQPARPTLVLVGSCIGARVISHRVISEIIIAREAPFPYDFLATQPILAAVPLQKNFPCVTNVLYQPWNGGDIELCWQHMRTLAHVWLQAERCERVICGQVETAKTEEGKHQGRWQTLEKMSS